MILSTYEGTAVKLFRSGQVLPSFSKLGNIRRADSLWKKSFTTHPGSKTPGFA